MKDHPSINECPDCGYILEMSDEECPICEVYKIHNPATENYVSSNNSNKKTTDTQEED